MKNEMMTNILVALRDNQEVDALKMEAFYRECERRAFKYYSVHNLSKLMEQDDFLQDVMEALYLSLPKFDEQRAGFATWFELKCRTISGKNSEKAINRMKYLPLTNAYVRDDEGDELCVWDSIEDKHAVDLGEQMVQLESQKWVQEALNKLPENYKKAIELVYLKGYKPREAALLLGCKSSDVSNWLNRGNKKLESILRDFDISF